ncbi:MAG: PHP domain-containing protein, partial [Planctomycetaceae bacterium]|nr:PHP domain-containing protein [Planctomycetaceae bacterium]
MQYAELHCLSNFSFLEAASHPDELVVRAGELGYTALAITDRNSLAGVVRAYTATKDFPIKLIVGAEITPQDGPPVVLWVKDRKGYANLCRLISLGRRRAVKGECHLTVEDIAHHSGQLLAGVVPSLRDESSSPASLQVYRDIFGSHGFLLAELHRGPHDHRRSEWLKDLSHQTGLPLLAAGNVLFHTSARRLLHDVLTAIRQRSTIELVGEHLLPNAERHLRTLETIQTTYAAIPGALARTHEVANQCTFSLEELRYEYPEELAPAGQTPIEYLKQLTWQGAESRYPQGIPSNVREALQHELLLIEELHYEAYFLTVWDLVRFARSREILCQGRGSAANSAVCYCLGITSVDPKRIDLLFERFI